MLDVGILVIDDAGRDNIDDSFNSPLPIDHGSLNIEANRSMSLSRSLRVIRISFVAKSLLNSFMLFLNDIVINNIACRTRGK